MRHGDASDGTPDPVGPTEWYMELSIHDEPAPADDPERDGHDLSRDGVSPPPPPPPPPPPQESSRDNARRNALLALLAALALLVAICVLLAMSGRRGAGAGQGTGVGNGVGAGVGKGTAVGNGAAEVDGPDPAGTAASGEGAAVQGAESSEVDPTGAPEPDDAPERPAEEPPTPKEDDPPALVTQVAVDPPPAVTPPSPRPATAASGAGPAGSGGGLGTGDISFRMHWRPPRGDIDLYVTDPLGHDLDNMKRTCACGGKLDRDDTTSGGPENIFWPDGKAPRGVYTYYANYCAGLGPKTVTFEIRDKGKLVKTHTAVLKSKRDDTERFTYRY